MASPNSKQVGGDHYSKHKIQPWDVMQEYLSPEAFQGYLQGNIIKYVLRAKNKGGIEDLQKAQHYLEKMVEVLSGEAPPIGRLYEHLGVYRSHNLDRYPDDPGSPIVCRRCLCASMSFDWFDKNECQAGRELP